MAARKRSKKKATTRRGEGKPAVRGVAEIKPNTAEPAKSRSPVKASAKAKRSPAAKKPAKKRASKSPEPAAQIKKPAAKKPAAKKPAAKKPAAKKPAAKKPAAKKPAAKKPAAKKPAAKSKAKAKAEELTPAQKGAITRKKNLAAKAAEVERLAKEAAEEAARIEAEDAKRTKKAKPTPKAPPRPEKRGAKKRAPKPEDDHVYTLPDPFISKEEIDRAAANRERALKGWRTRRELARILEKGDRARIPKKDRVFLEEHAKKSKSPEIKEKAVEVLLKQEAVKGPTEKIIEQLQSMRREAIKEKVGWYPKKLKTSVYVGDDEIPLTKAAPGKTWLEEDTRFVFDENRKPVAVKFRYRRRHERLGIVLSDTTIDRIQKTITDRYMEMYEAATKVSPHVRGFIQIWGYTMAGDIDDDLIKAYGEFVRLPISNDNKPLPKPKRRHKIGRADDKAPNPFVQRDNLKLVMLPESSAISSDPDIVIEGLQAALWKWSNAVERAVIVDSFFISIEERPIPPKNRSESKRFPQVANEVSKPSKK